MYDVTIVEIRKEDKIKPDSFFDIDENVYDPNYNFKDNLIILLHYPKGDEMSLSTGSIKKVGVDEKDYELFHLCSSDHGSSGGPLINIKDYKVLGIHKGASKEFNFNFATLLKKPIIEFKNQIQNFDNKSKDNKNKIINNEKKNVELIEEEKKSDLNELTEKKKELK